MSNRRWMTALSVPFMAFVFLLGALPAEAHFFSIVPDTKIHSVSVGSEYQVKLSFTEEFFNVQAGAAYLNLSSDIFSARFLYNDGTSLAFPAFSDYDEPGAKIVEGTDSHVSRAVLGKAGTVVLDARVDNVPYGHGEMKMRYWGYSKQILNAKADGYSVKPVGGSDVLEIVPASEVAEFSAGKTVTFKVLFKGQPLSGAKVEWADQKSPVVIGDEGPTNTAEVATTGNDGTFRFTIKNSGYNCFGIMHRTPPAGTDRKADYYASTLIFDVPGTSGGKSGGSGCNAGFGFLLLAAVGAFIGKRRR